MKLQVTMMIKDLKYRALDKKVEKYLQKQIEKKQLKIIKQVRGYRRQTSKPRHFTSYTQKYVDKRGVENISKDNEYIYRSMSDKDSRANIQKKLKNNRNPQ